MILNLMMEGEYSGRRVYGETEHGDHGPGTQVLRRSFLHPSTQGPDGVDPPFVWTDRTRVVPSTLHHHKDSFLLLGHT